MNLVNRYREIGLLLLRIGLGLSFLFHGIPKLLGGPETWKMLGGATSAVGISFAPTFWGFMAGLSEAGGAVLILLGIFFRPACFLMAVTMGVALMMHIGKGDPFTVYSHALEDGILFLCLILIGPGRYVLKKNRT